MLVRYWIKEVEQPSIPQECKSIYKTERRFKRLGYKTTKADYLNCRVEMVKEDKRILISWE